VATIRAQNNLRTDFDAMVNYLRSFILTINQETRNVSQVESKASHRKTGGKVKPHGSNTKSKKKKGKCDTVNDKSLDKWYT
jgi:hypothetical protein